MTNSQWPIGNRWAVLVLGVLCLAVLPAAQQATFKTKVTHVQVDVVVTDRDDRPITDLTAADFEIWERGRKQTITDFEFISVPLAGRSIDLEAEPGPPPDVVSNAPPARTARAFAFVLDDATLSTATIVWIKEWMTDFLSHLHADDQVAITYVSRSDLGQDFTHDAGLLVRAVNNLRTALGSGADLCRHTVPVMKNVVRSIAGAVETRRAVVLVGERWPNILGCVNEVRELYEQATRAGVPIYTFSPTGLSAPDLGFEGHLENQTPEARAAKDAAVKAGKEGLIEMALNTGGRAFVYHSDSPRAIREIVTENGSYYLLGYYPTPDVADGRYHDIDVKVTRPGVRVRARAGYTAGAPAAFAARPPRLADALTNGLPGGDLLVHGFLAPVTLSKNAAKVLLTLDVAYPALDVATSRRDDDLRIVWMALDPDARVRASGENRPRMPMARSGRDAITASINHLIDLPKGTAVVRVAVASASLERQGVVHLPVSVPTWPGRPIEITPLVLGTRASANDVTVALGGSARVMPFQPTTTRAWAASERLQIFSRVYASRPAEATAELIVRRGDAIIRRSVVPLTPAASDRPALECRATLALADLPAGDYVLELVAKAGLDTATRQVPFQVR